MLPGVSSQGVMLRKWFAGSANGEQAVMNSVKINQIPRLFASEDHLHSTNTELASPTAPVCSLQGCSSCLRLSCNSPPSPVVFACAQGDKQICQFVFLVLDSLGVPGFLRVVARVLIGTGRVAFLIPDLRYLLFCECLILAVE